MSCESILSEYCWPKLACWRLALLARPLDQAAGEAAHVVVVVNANDSGSAEIANYYTEQRGIPEDNIIALKMPNKETVTVREFVDTIYNPLLNALIQKDWMNAVKANESRCRWA